MERGRPEARGELAPEALIRETFLLGPVEAQRERLAEFAAAGIDTAVLAVACPPAELPHVIDGFAPLGSGQPACGTSTRVVSRTASCDAERRCSS